MWDIAHRRCQKSLDAHAHFATSLDFHRYIDEIFQHITIIYFLSVMRLIFCTQVTALCCHGLSGPDCESMQHDYTDGFSKNLSHQSSFRYGNVARPRDNLMVISTVVGETLYCFFLLEIGTKWFHCPQMGTFWSCSWG